MWNILYVPAGPNWTSSTPALGFENTSTSCPLLWDHIQHYSLWPWQCKQQVYVETLVFHIKPRRWSEKKYVFDQDKKEPIPFVQKKFCQWKNLNWINPSPNCQVLWVTRLVSQLHAVSSLLIQKPLLPLEPGCLYKVNQDLDNFLQCPLRSQETLTIYRKCVPLSQWFSVIFTQCAFKLSNTKLPYSTLIIRQ